MTVAMPIPTGKAQCDTCRGPAELRIHVVERDDHRLIETCRTCWYASDGPAPEAIRQVEILP